MRWIAFVLLSTTAACASAQTTPEPSFVGSPERLSGMRPVVEWAAIPACLSPRASTPAGLDGTSPVNVPLVGAHMRLLGAFRRRPARAVTPPAAEEWIDSSRGELLRAGIAPAATRLSIAWLLTDTYIDSTGRRLQMHCGDCAAVTSRCRLEVGPHEAALIDVRVSSFGGYEGIQVWLLWPAPAGAWRYLTLASHDSAATERFEAAMRTVKIE